MDIRKFLKKRSLPSTTEDSDSTKVPRLESNSEAAIALTIQETQDTKTDSKPENSGSSEETTTLPSTSNAHMHVRKMLMYRSTHREPGFLAQYPTGKKHWLK